MGGKFGRHESDNDSDSDIENCEGGNPRVQEYGGIFFKLRGEIRHCVRILQATFWDFWMTGGITRPDLVRQSVRFGLW